MKATMVIASHNAKIAGAVVGFISIPVVNDTPAVDLPADFFLSSPRRPLLSRVCKADISLRVFERLFRHGRDLDRLLILLGT